MIWWTRVQNKKELKKYRKQGVVLVCNHLSNADIPAMFCGMPREIFFISKPELFKKKIPAWFFRNLNGFPIERGKDLALMKHCLGVLKRDKALLIFPEGMRTFNPEDALALRNGASVIAIKGNVPIIPMVMNRPPRPFRLTKIKVGTAISTEELQGRKLEKDEITAFSDKVADIMAEMLNEPGFQVVAKRKKWDMAKVDTARAICFRNIDGVDHILLHKRNRPHYKDGADYYNTPGGHLEPEETPKEAVIREVLEETGIHVNPLRVLYKRVRADASCRPGCASEMEAFLVCEYKSGEIIMNPESEEYSEELKTMCDKSGRLIGTYQPMWIPLAQIFEPDFELKPKQFHDQLKKDIQKKGTRIVKKTELLKT